MSFLFEQLPLAVQLRDEYTFENFFPGDNGLIVDALGNQLSAVDRYIYLHGRSGSGRSHLLQAACHHAQQKGRGAVYLPLRELRNYDPEALFEGLQQLALVCLDDLDQVVGNGEWEQALFHLFNRLQDYGVGLLVSASAAVRELNIGLKDLASRLGWGAVFQLQPLNDQQQQAFLQLRAKGRGLALSEESAAYILKRCQRDTASLMMVLDTLDQASLQQRRKLTIPFIGASLGWTPDD